MIKASELDSNVAEVVEFSRKTEEALKRIEVWKGITMGFDEFIEDMKKW